MTRVLVTGATGCVGHEVASRLLGNGDLELLLLVRDPARLRLPAPLLACARVLTGDLRDAERHAEVLRTADVAVLAATSWDHGPESIEVNVDATLRLARLLGAGRCSHVVYFSTASILATDGSPLREAERIGTGYIRSKYLARAALRDARDVPPVTTLYPTLVLGGDDGAPRSHLTNLLREVARRRLLHRLVTADGSFHFAHALDIASIVEALVRGGPPEGTGDLVLGGARVTIDEALDALGARLGRRRLARVPLSPRLAERLLDLLRVQLAPWDRYCMRTRHFAYDHATLGESLGVTPRYPTLESALASLPLA